ncbi:heterogeneous nuclear ribonucleoprotein A1-like 3 [Acanthopagrus schlegelii]
MTSGNMDVKKAPNKRVFISLPKKHFPGLEKYYELDHGLFVSDLIPHINEGYLQAYFREWGTVTACKIRKNPDVTANKAVAYVRFATEEEADRADWAGPHNIGGGDVIVKRVVSPRLDNSSDEEVSTVSAKTRPRRSLGMGYILEDAQWLDNELE